MWIEDHADLDTVKTWVKHCPAMKLVTTMDGKILWANEAFIEWSQYTLAELTKITWMQLSVADENLEYDIASAKMLDVYSPTYKVKKQYIPKGSKPEWGILNVMRYPMSGEIKWCLCTWEPLRNGTATAFAQAMENANKIEKRLEDMASCVKFITSQTEEDRFLLSAIAMIKKHPKVAIAFLVMALGMFGANNMLELLQRTGIIEIPIRVEAVVPREGVGSINNHANDIARHY